MAMTQVISKANRIDNKDPQMLLLPLQINLEYLSLRVTLIIRIMISRITRDTKMAGILRTALLIYTGWYSAEGTGHLESDDYPNEEEGEDISDNSPSQGSTGSTDDGFSNLIDMVVDITTFLWGLVSNWF
ncbi:TPA: hypothetical protein ACP0OY_001068 [Streptococcus pyogenes]